MRRNFGIAAAVVLLMAGRSDAQQIVYNNTTNFTGLGWYEDPQQTLTSFDPTTNNRMTIFMADDIFTAPNTTTTIGKFQFSAFNDNGYTVTARPRIFFYNNNGLNGGPGTFLANYDLNPMDLPGDPTTGNTLLISVDITAVPFSVDGSFWAGVAFDDFNGTTGITENELLHLGQALFNPPTIGSSSDNYFHSAALRNFSVNNPQGLVDNLLVIPANFYWQFTKFSGVPEPSTFVLIVAGGGLFWIARRRTARSAA